MPKKDETLGERIKRIRGAIFQAEFGKQLGVSQGTVSAWERDDKARLPSAEIYFRLAMLASCPEDHAFFLQRAGLSREVIVSAANKIASDLIVHPKQGDMVLIGSLRGGFPALEVPASLVADPVMTRYFAIDKFSKGHGQEVGDIFLIDISRSDQPNLLPFWDELVLLELDFKAVFPKPPSPHPQKEYQVGWLTLGEEPIPEPDYINVFIAELHPWKMDSDSLRHAVEFKPHPRKPHTEERLTLRPDRPLQVGHWAQNSKAAIQQTDGVTKKGADMAGGPTSSLPDIASAELRLNRGMSVKGRVIGWFRPAVQPARGV